MGSSNHGWALVRSNYPGRYTYKGTENSVSTFKTRPSSSHTSSNFRASACKHKQTNISFLVPTPTQVSIVSIPTIFDPALAPPGKAVVHAYYAASEPYELWDGLIRGTPQYAAMKEERAKPLWKVRGLRVEGLWSGSRLRADIKCWHLTSKTKSAGERCRQSKFCADSQLLRSLETAGAEGG